VGVGFEVGDLELVGLALELGLGDEEPAGLLPTVDDGEPAGLLPTVGDEEPVGLALELGEPEGEAEGEADVEDGEGDGDVGDGEGDADVGDAEGDADVGEAEVGAADVGEAEVGDADVGDADVRDGAADVGDGDADELGELEVLVMGEDGGDDEAAAVRDVGVTTLARAGSCVPAESPAVRKPPATRPASTARPCA
jgi:hypothetical protein